MTDLPYATIEVSGPDARSFLQGQLTANLERLPPGAATRAAWCNPKGRVICVMNLAARDDGYALTLPAELAEPVLQRLTLFRFRARVDFRLRPATSGECGLEAGAVGEGLLERLRSGVPEVWKEQSEKFTAHMLNLDLLGAISLDKGCYTGQEIIARTHYRGATKRRCLRFEADGPVRPGDKVLEGDREVGEVLNAIGTDLLAVIALDSAENKLTAGGTGLRPVALPYLDAENKIDQDKKK
jgi:folate-binding protein YgfZ